MTIDFTIRATLTCDICHKQIDNIHEVPKGWKIQFVDMDEDETVMLDLAFDAALEWSDGFSDFTASMYLQAVCPDCDPMDLEDFNPDEWDIFIKGE